jgi:hypothetical protein
MPQIGMIKDHNPKSGMDIYVVSVPAYGATYHFSTFRGAHEFAMRAMADIKDRGLAA